MDVQRNHLVLPNRTNPNLTVKRAFFPLGQANSRRTTGFGPTSMGLVRSRLQMAYVTIGDEKAAGSCGRWRSGMGPLNDAFNRCYVRHEVVDLSGPASLAVGACSCHSERCPCCD